MDIGFIGTGNMGSGMVVSLMRRGHKVSVYNRTAHKAQPLIDLGARAVRSIAEACQFPVVFSMLADDRALEEVTLGAGGILEALPQGAIHVSSGTVSVNLAQRLAQAHSSARRGFVSAPVFGRPDAAASGKLFVIVAGHTPALEQLTPLLEAIGQRTFVVGEEPHVANLIKLSGNFLIAAVIEILGEAMALADKGGVDRHRYLEILTSTLFGAPVFKTYGALLADRKFTPAGFAAPLGQKDIRLTLQAAEALAVPMPMASLLRDRFLRLAAHKREELDWAAIGYLAAVDAGAQFP
jgi:3-hydroxyisobutyrate dehydrogenase-like beta-hydroxyacid dehydrogenase